MDGSLFLLLVLSINAPSTQENAQVPTRVVHAGPSTEPQPGRFGAALWGARIADHEWIAIGAPNAGSEALPRVGEVLALADRKVVWRARGTNVRDGLGASVVALDRQQTGAWDALAIGATQGRGPFDAPPSGPGLVELRRLTDGELLCAASGAILGDAFGSALCPLGDLDGDGFNELAIGAPQVGGERTIPSTLPGYVTVVSTKDGSILWTITGPAQNRRFGGTLARLGDLDHDGQEDLAVGAEGPSEAVWAPGAILLVSAKTGMVLFEAVEQGPLRSVGATLVSTDDLDGDGKADAFAIGVPAPLSKGSTAVDVLLLSGADGRMTSIASIESGARFGSFALAAGAWRDGSLRIAIQLAGSVNGDNEGRVEILDPRAERPARFELHQDPVDGEAVDWCAFQAQACVAVVANADPKRDSTWLVGAPSDRCWGRVVVFDGVRWADGQVLLEKELAREFRPQ